MTERVKVYEEGGKKAGIPLWAWLVPLLLLLALLAYFLTRHKSDNTTPAATPTATAAPAALPTLAAVHFATDKSDLSPEAKSTLDQAAVAMKQDKNIHLRVEGYTDATGTTAHNENLAGARAASVVEYLKAKGVDNAQLTGEGFGPEKPVDTNATASGKADNRRVELFRAQ
jgi:outer membrane protein OmpA-like peptidoglycan-associated protein